MINKDESCDPLHFDCLVCPKKKDCNIYYIQCDRYGSKFLADKLSQINIVKNKYKRRW